MVFFEQAKCGEFPLAWDAGLIAHWMAKQQFAG
jgi:hypothetical protein